MTIFLGLVIVALLVLLAIQFFKSKRLVALLATRTAEVAASQQEAAKAFTDAQAAVTNAQQLVDEQIQAMRAEAERVQKHYEAEALKIQESSQVLLKQTLAELEPLRKYETLRDQEAETQKVLAEAITEATSLRDQAHALLEQARNATEQERLRATQQAKDIYEQASACLNQATRDAGRIVSEGERKAKEIAGDAYTALRDKQLLEQAAEALRNMIEGYGDRYLIPTHSVLDDLAAEFGYTSAGESLKSARLQSRRMIEQGQAASCEYVETSCRETAIHFVIDAFNGRVDGILSRVKSTNQGVLEREVRDAFSLVNLNGAAFRNARILESYLEARLAELKWAVVVQELARKERDEQRALKERLRDEEKARKEYEAKMREAMREEEAKKKALDEKEQELAEARASFAAAAAEEKEQWLQRISALESANQGLQTDLAAATEKKLTIAQQTKKGHVYIISNLGSFGENVYKIGQTRRLNKQERVDELGDASVPFEFDVHAWIESDNAPVLEHKLQRCFLTKQLNKINPRREFFRVTLQELRKEIDRLATSEPFTITHWTELAAATHYRESRDVESDPDRLAKWLKRQQALTARQLQLDALRLSTTDITRTASEDEAP